ncbi:hypothetical protein SLS62_006094 [Diatrype stigma]|uniref:Major facilitator superfamily (MFS) profile domain-containing protein n=1 Tax=Diatrype stigma TaxID=117547 RepID=A0AAN9URK1_9PEZI
MVSSPEDRSQSADVVSSSEVPKADHDIADEKDDHAASDPEKLQRQGDEQTTQIDPEVAKRIAANVEDFMRLVREANEANDRERDMKLSTAVKIYPKAIGWSMVLSSCLIMEGYQTSVIGSYTAYPAFLKKFGTPAPNGMLQIPANWQNGITGAKNVGEIIAGWLSEIYGYRWTILPGLIAITAFVFFPFFAPTLAIFLVGEFFQGMAW